MTSRARVFARQFLLQAGWNYDRMQHIGVAFALLPELVRIHRRPEAVRAAVLRHLDYFNTQPYMAGPLLGATLRLEEEVAAGTRAPEDVSSFKASIMGSYGAIGDSFFWAALRPLGGVIAIALVLLHAGPLGALVFVVAYDAVAISLRSWGFFTGAAIGPTVVAKLARLDFATATRRLKIAGAMTAGIVAAVWSRQFVSHGSVSPSMVALPLLVVTAGAARRGFPTAATALLAVAVAAAANGWIDVG